MSGIKVTSYDFNYLQSNPYKGITKEILLASLHKVQVDTLRVKCPQPPTESTGLSSYLCSLRNMWANDDDDNKERSNYLYEIDCLKAKQANAVLFEDWEEASLKLDELEGNDKWKLEEKSDLYDYQEVKKQLLELQRCRACGDYEHLLYLIRTSWRRDFGGINNKELYKKCHIGTKKLIEDYIKECSECLAELASPKCPLDDTYLLEVLMESKRSYGRAAITLSGGGAFGLIGIGLFSTLLEKDVFPKIVSGSSGGSIISSIICSKSSDEVIEILGNIFDNKFEAFSLEDESDTIYSHLSRILKYGVWFDNKYLQNTMQNFLGNITFKEAFNKTGRILNITVSSASVHDQPTLLNYLTAPNVLVWSAVCTSCSLPFVFPSSAIYEKNMQTGDIDKWSNPSLKFVDGSLNSDLPIARLSEMFNVNHVIACQMNPHITPLVKLASDCLDATNAGVNWMVKRYAFKLASLATQETIHYMDILNELGVCENLAKKVKQMLIQSYSGDITILPEINPSEFNKTLSNPTPSFIWECILNGARSTWPELSMIEDQLSLEFALDKYISIIKSRVVFGSTRASSMSTIKNVRSSSSMFENAKANSNPKLRTAYRLVSNSVSEHSKKPLFTKRQDRSTSAKTSPIKLSYNGKHQEKVRFRGKSISFIPPRESEDIGALNNKKGSTLRNSFIDSHKGLMDKLKSSQMEKIESEEPPDDNEGADCSYSYYGAEDEADMLTFDELSTPKPKRAQGNSENISPMKSNGSPGDPRTRSFSSADYDDPYVLRYWPHENGRRTSLGGIPK